MFPFTSRSTRQARWAARAVLALALVALLGAHAPALADPAQSLIDGLLKNDNHKVRLKAAQALARFSSPAVVAALGTATQDPNALVRAAAANSLGRIGVRAGVASICPLQRDTDSFVRQTAVSALGRFGGVSACAAQRVFLEILVTGEDTGVQQRVQAGLTARATRDERLLTAPSGDEADPRAAVDAGRLSGVQMRIHLGRKVDRSTGTVTIECEMAQSIFDLKLKALRGSTIQRAQLDLGSGAVSDQAIAAQSQACIEALVPAVFDGLSDYLNRLK